MDTAGLKLNLHSLYAPKSREDLILLLEEACAEFAYINAHLAKIIESGKVAEAA
ncbi:hypothetical protein IMW82_12460 [Rhodanobacter sp. B2A1Ga4]|uniref:hypothetical protein n=1 Tax=Rhodanobacter sp. B2A1Ga4 TaxID=2778647 RepID=UPI001B37A7EA|nr:hypothetical protein [Rhodanobacter sp. B2A1Ga4]MBQ4855481.1 hypothetical protein [Rhodanobacter sp. B2A1Ga4]